MGPSFHVFPIGRVRKEQRRTFIDIDPAFEDGLLGLEGFSHIWVLYWFHENDSPEQRRTLQVHPRKDPQNPKWPERDRFVLSKGHGAGCLYIVMADTGYFSEQSLVDTYGKPETRFGVHPDMHKVPGVEASTGSLGHGLSISVGMAAFPEDAQNMEKLIQGADEALYRAKKSGKNRLEFKE